MDDITAAQRRVEGYWFVDGVAEILGGATFALVGVLLYAAGVTGIGWLGTAALIVLFLSGWMVAWVVRVVKERITYPRTGYVAFAPPSRARGLTAAVVAMFGAAFIASRVAGSSDVSVVLLGSGLGIGTAMAVRAWRTGAVRFYVVAASVVVSSGILATNGTGIEEGSGLMIAFAGLTLVVTGTWALVHYLRANPASEGSVA